MIQACFVSIPHWYCLLMFPTLQPHGGVKVFFLFWSVNFHSLREKATISAALFHFLHSHTSVCRTELGIYFPGQSTFRKWLQPPPPTPYLPCQHSVISNIHQLTYFLSLFITKNLIFEFKIVFPDIYLRLLKCCFAVHVHNDRMTTSQANQQPQQHIAIPKFSLSVDFQFGEQYWLHSSCCGCIMRLLLPPVRQVCAPWPASPISTW